MSTQTKSKRNWIAMLAVAGTCIFAGPAIAAPVSVSQQIFSGGPASYFHFNIAAPIDSDGTGGLMLLTMNGDYTQGFSSSENIRSYNAFDSVGGFPYLRLGNEAYGPSGIVNNTVAGLTYSSVTRFINGGSNNDWTLNWVFNVSAALLNTLLANDSITISFQNSNSVDLTCTPPSNAGPCGVDPDFLRLEFQYESAAIPVPAALPLFSGAMGLLAFIAMRRRRTG